MSKKPDRLLDRAPILEEGPSLGRVFGVVRETWLLREDPRAVAPRTEVVASRRTALEAADLARDLAQAFDRHGFHKPSGAWWASDGVRLHRLSVRAQRPGGTAGLLGAGVAALTGLAAVGLVGALQRARRKAASRA